MSFFRQTTFGFIYTMKCTAACSHCCFECTPDRKEKMDVQLAKAVIGSETMRRRFDTVFFSGGEIFLYFDELIALMREAKKFYSIRCATNGFWGADAQTAEKYIRSLKKSGLSELHISHDEFHAEYIPASSVETILWLCKKYYISVEVQGTVSNQSWKLSEVARVADKVPDIPVSCSAVLPIGGAKAWDKNEFFYSDAQANDRCIGSDALTIYPNGDVYSCCSPAGHSIKALNQGTFFSGISETEIEKIISNRAMINFLTKYGIKGTFKKLWPDYFGGLEVEEPYINVCDICRHMLHQIPDGKGTCV